MPEPNLAARERMTAQEYWARRADFDHTELIDGEVVPMAPTGTPHGFVECDLAYELGRYTRETGQGRVGTGEVGYQLTDDLVRAADVVLHLQEPPPEGPGWATQLPDLVVEVLAPSDSWTGVERKVVQYLEAGVTEVWIADPGSKTVVVRRTDAAPRVLRGDTRLESDLLPGFSVELCTIFR